MKSYERREDFLMKQKPWILIVLAFLHFIAPLGTMVINALWAGRDIVTHIELVFRPYNLVHQWPHILLPWIAAYAIWACRRWSLYLYFACIVALCVLSYMGFQGGNAAISPLRLIGLYLFNIFVVTYFLLPAVRKVYLDPRMRWWETRPRYFIRTQVQFGPQSEHEGMVENISETGLLLKSNNVPPDHSIVSIKMYYDGENYEFSGRVIHHSHLEKMGFGVQFISDLAVKKKLRYLTQLLEQKGLLDRQRMPTEDDGFIAWLRAALRGKGLIPGQDRKK